MPNRLVDQQTRCTQVCSLAEKLEILLPNLSELTIFLLQSAMMMAVPKSRNGLTTIQLTHLTPTQTLRSSTIPTKQVPLMDLLTLHTATPDPLLGVAAAASITT